jgi:hypothetical protein
MPHSYCLISYICQKFIVKTKIQAIASCVEHSDFTIHVVCVCVYNDDDDAEKRFMSKSKRKENYSLGTDI